MEIIGAFGEAHAPHPEHANEEHESPKIRGVLEHVCAGEDNDKENIEYDNHQGEEGIVPEDFVVEAVLEHDLEVARGVEDVYEHDEVVEQEHEGFHHFY